MRRKSLVSFQLRVRPQIAVVSRPTHSLGLFRGEHEVQVSGRHDSGVELPEVRRVVERESRRVPVVRPQLGVRPVKLKHQDDRLVPWSGDGAGVRVGWGWVG